MPFTSYFPDFFTATILEWKPLLKQDKFKDILIQSLQYLVKDERILLYGFVIMNNHIHLIWQVADKYKPAQVQQSFMKYTAQIILKELRNNHPQVLEHFRMNAKDRKIPGMGKKFIECFLMEPESISSKIGIYS